MFESPGIVTRLDDLAVMRDPVEKRGGHLLVTEDLRPLCERKIGGDQ